MCCRTPERCCLWAVYVFFTLVSVIIVRLAGKGLRDAGEFVPILVGLTPSILFAIIAVAVRRYQMRREQRRLDLRPVLASPPPPSSSSSDPSIFWRRGDGDLGSGATFVDISTISGHVVYDCPPKYEEVVAVDRAGRNIRSTQPRDRPLSDLEASGPSFSPTSSYSTVGTNVAWNAPSTPEDRQLQETTTPSHHHPPATANDGNVRHGRRLQTTTTAAAASAGGGPDDDDDDDETTTDVVARFSDGHDDDDDDDVDGTGRPEPSSSSAATASLSPSMMGRSPTASSLPSYEEAMRRIHAGNVT